MNRYGWLGSVLLLLILVLLGLGNSSAAGTAAGSPARDPGLAHMADGDRVGAEALLPVQGTPTPTPSCCMLTGSIQPTCAYNPGTQLYDINFMATLTNACGSTLNVATNFYLEVSTDGVNFGFVRRTSIQNYSFPPGPSVISDGFAGVSIDPSNLYYRIRMQIYACGIYEIYSPAALLCGASTPTPTPTQPVITFTPSATRTPGGPPPTATTGCCPTPTASGAGVCAAPGNYYYTFDVTNPCFRSQSGATQFFLDVAPGSGGPWTLYDQTALQSVLLPANSTTSYSGVFTETLIPGQYQWYRIRLVLLTANCSGTIYTYAQTDPAALCGSATTTPTASSSSSPTLTATPGISATTTVCPLTFADVLPADPFYPYIRCLACRGILSGYSTSPPCAPGGTPCFNGGATITRGQVAKIVSNAAGFVDPIPLTRQTFTDVPYGSPFWIYIERLAEPSRMYISGYISNPPCPAPGAPAFCPGNNVTRSQMAKIDANAEGYAEPVPSTQQTFTDVPYGSPFWLYVERASLHGVISGYSTNPPCSGGVPCFLPGNMLTRNQAAKIVVVTFFPNCPTPAR
jgi:hypothetical protein